MLSRPCLIGLSLLALFAAILMGIGTGMAGEPLKPGGKFPSFALETLNPEECGTKSYDTASVVGLSPTKPTKLLIVVFGAWSCKPCKRAIAHLEKLRVGEKKPEWHYVIVVEDREREEQKKFLEHVKSLGSKAPLLADVDGLVLSRAGCERLPCTLAANAWGIIVGYWQKYDEKIETQLDQLVKESKEW